MLRLVLFGVFISTFLNGNSISPSAVIKVDDGSNTTYEVDPIITGNGIDEAHLAKWKVQNELFLKCGDCAIKPQAYPGN